MIQITKLITRILMNRARSRIRCQIEQEEHDFVEDTGIKTVTFLIRMIECNTNIERLLLIVHGLKKLLQYDEMFDFYWSKP